MIWAGARARTHTHTHTCTRAHTHTHTHMRALARSLACSRVHARTYTKPHINTHTHTPHAQHTYAQVALAVAQQLPGVGSVEALRERGLLQSYPGAVVLPTALYRPTTAAAPPPKGERRARTRARAGRRAADPARCCRGVTARRRWLAPAGPKFGSLVSSSSPSPSASSSASSSP